MYFSFLVFKTSEKYKFGGLYIKIFEKFEFQKKNFVKAGTKILKNPFFAKNFKANCIFLCQIGI